MRGIFNETFVLSALHPVWSITESSEKVFPVLCIGLCPCLYITIIYALDNILNDLTTPVTQSHHVFYFRLRDSYVSFLQSLVLTHPSHTLQESSSPIHWHLWLWLFQTCSGTFYINQSTYPSLQIPLPIHCNNSLSKNVQNTTRITDVLRCRVSSHHSYSAIICFNSHVTPIFSHNKL